MSALKRGAGVLACLLPAMLLVALLSCMVLQAWVEPDFGLVCALSVGTVLIAGTLFRRGNLWILGVLLLMIPSVLAFFLSGVLTDAESVSPLFAALMVVGPCAALVTGLSAKRVILPPLIIITVGLVIITAVLGRKLTLPDVGLACVALMAFTARSALHRWNTLPSPQAEGTLAAWILPVAAAFALVAWVVLMPYQELPRNEKLHQKLEFVQEMIRNLVGEPEPRSSFSLVDTGMRPDGSQLGGPALISDLPTLKVKVSRTDLLLRGAVFQDYNGHTWSNSQQTQRYALAAGEDLTRVFDLDLPAEDTGMKEVTVWVELLEDGTASLFVPYRVTELQPASVLTMMAFFNDRGEVFNTQDMTAGLAYTVTAHLPYRELSDWAQEGLPASDVTVDSVYTALPKDLPESVREFALEATADCTNDAQRVQALADALANHLTYTLEPASPPRDQDFVAWTLESGEGYCTYYATAMTVLARTLGIPARYVEGYSLPNDARANQEIILTEAESHAWSEVYLAGVGWYPVDATRSGGPKEDEPQATPTPTPEPTPQPTPTPMPEEDSPRPTPTPPPREEQKRDWRGRRTLLWGLLGLALAAMLLILPPWLRSLQEKRLSATPEGAMRIQLLAIARLLAYLGIKPRPGETANRFAARVDQELPENHITGGDLANLINRMYFAPNGTVTANDLRIAQRYRGFLERTLRKDKGTLGYLLREKYRLIKP